MDHKAHRTPKAGVKAAKKKNKDLKKKGALSDPTQKINKRAFTFKSAAKAHLQRQRNADREHKHHHSLIANRNDVGTHADPPPILIAVVGPKGVGKSTIIRGLVKHYTKFNLGGSDQDTAVADFANGATIQGPITVVSGKNRRLTFFEVGPDLFSMIDLAKTADLILLVVDASFGFEMETFEFLNIAQTHGFPRVMGVLTHLDKFKSGKTVKKLKTTMKQRFWSEIYDGAKMFYFSGIKYGKYPKNEIMNLARFISVMKFRPLVWRNSHSYVLSDRVEDITDPSITEENPAVNRRVSFYGYVRGTNLKPSQKVHLIGVGDFKIDRITVLPDPCPLPERNSETNKRKGLNDKQKLLYAPMSNIGDLVYDADAIYINIKDSQVSFTPSADTLSGGSILLPKEEGEGEKMVKTLQDLHHTIDERLEQSELRLFKNSKPIRSEEVNFERRQAPEKNEEINASYQSEDEEGHSDSDDEIIASKKNDLKLKAPTSSQNQDFSEKNEGDSEDESVISDEGSDDEEPVYSEDEESHSRWQAQLVEKAKNSIQKQVNLMDVSFMNFILFQKSLCLNSLYTVILQVLQNSPKAKMMTMMIFSELEKLLLKSLVRIGLMHLEKAQGKLSLIGMMKINWRRFAIDL
jgi:ribosome biogenesis protein BMS1